MHDLNPQPMNPLSQRPSNVDGDKDSLCVQFTSTLPCDEGHYTIKKIMPKYMSLKSEFYSSTAIEKKLFLIRQGKKKKKITD